MPVIDRWLNHTEANKGTRVCQRDELLPQRVEALNRLGERLDILTTGITDNVLSMIGK